MKVSLEQLRRLVRESLESELAASATDVHAPAKYIAESLAKHIRSSDSNAIFNHAWRMMSYDVEDGDMLVPARIEDVDAMSDTVADRVLADPAVKDAVKEIAMKMYSEMMRGAR